MTEEMAVKKVFIKGPGGRRAKGPRTRCVDGVDAVSYTHLDVYKRQIIHYAIP